jgi:hypothetical protein
VNRLIRQAAFVLFAVSMSPALASRSYAALELTPFIGVYHPIESEVNELTFPLIISVSPGTIYGARVGWWMGPRFGFEGSVGVAATSMRATGGGAGLESNGSVVLADGRVRVHLNPGSSTQFDVFGGGGIVKPRWDLDDIFSASGLEWKSRFGGVVGLGVTANVLSGAGIRFDFEDHIHNGLVEVDETISTLDQPDRMQHDLVWTVGLVIPI